MMRRKHDGEDDDDDEDNPGDDDDERIFLPFPETSFLVAGCRTLHFRSVAQLAVVETITRYL